MQKIELNVRYIDGREEIKIKAADELEEVTAECRWLLEMVEGAVAVSFSAFGSNYIIEKF